MNVTRRAISIGGSILAFAVAVAAGVLLVTSFSGDPTITQTSDAMTRTVTDKETVNVEPDIAVRSFGVESTGEDLWSVRATAQKNTDALVTALVLARYSRSTGPEQGQYQADTDVAFEATVHSAVVAAAYGDGGPRYAGQQALGDNQQNAERLAALADASVGEMVSIRENAMVPACQHAQLLSAAGGYGASQGSCTF